MKNTCFGSFIFVFCMFWVSFAQAGQKLEVLTEDWAPFNYQNNGKITGFSSEVVKAVLNEAEIPYQIRMGVWKGVYSRALSEPNILIYTISRTAEREDKISLDWADSGSKTGFI